MSPKIACKASKPTCFLPIPFSPRRLPRRQLAPLDGKEETFNVQVFYDTLELYGKVSASRTVTIYRE